MDYYQILNVHRDASAHQIKTSYRRLAKIYHPDHNPKDPKTAERMTQKLNEAYAILSNADKRRQYDAKFEKKSSTHSHPNADPYQGPRPREHFADAEARAEALLRKEKKDSANKYGNRFESKDAFCALVVCFFLMIQPPAGYQLNFGSFLVAWPIFAVAILSAQIARALAGAYLAFVFKGGRDSLLLLIVANGAAAVQLGFAAKGIEWALRQPMFFFPLVPALLAVIIPGTVGAGIGRAFSRSIGNIAGLIGGGLTSALTALACVLWIVLVQVVEKAGQNMSPDEFTKPVLAALAAASVAGCLGSIRISGVFVYSLLDWAEAFFDRSSISPDSSKALVARE